MTTVITDYDARELSKFELLIEQVDLATGAMGTDGNPDEKLTGVLFGSQFANNEWLPNHESLRIASLRPEYPTGVNMHLYVYPFLGHRGYVFNIADLFGVIRYQQAVITRLMGADK